MQAVQIEIWEFLQQKILVTGALGQPARIEDLVNAGNSNLHLRIVFQQQVGGSHELGKATIRLHAACGIGDDPRCKAEVD